jgi:hypothetical protein
MWYGSAGVPLFLKGREEQPASELPKTPHLSLIEICYWLLSVLVYTLKEKLSAQCCCSFVDKNGQCISNGADKTISLYNSGPRGDWLLLLVHTNRITHRSFIKLWIWTITYTLAFIRSGPGYCCITLLWYVLSQECGILWVPWLSPWQINIHLYPCNSSTF